MNTQSNYAAERAASSSIEEITIQDVSAERFRLESANDPEEFDIEAADHLGYDDAPSEEQARMMTGTFAYGFDPHELDAGSAHRAFCNNFSD